MGAVPKDDLLSASSWFGDSTVSSVLWSGNSPALPPLPSATLLICANLGQSTKGSEGPRRAAARGSAPASLPAAQPEQLLSQMLLRVFRHHLSEGDSADPSMLVLVSSVQHHRTVSTASHICSGCLNRADSFQRCKSHFFSGHKIETKKVEPELELEALSINDISVKRCCVICVIVAWFRKGR